MSIGAFYTVMRLNRLRRAHGESKEKPASPYRWGEKNVPRHIQTARRKLDIEIKEMRKEHAPVDLPKRGVGPFLFWILVLAYVLMWALQSWIISSSFRY